MSRLLFPFLRLVESLLIRTGLPKVLMELEKTCIALVLSDRYRSNWIYSLTYFYSMSCILKSSVNSNKQYGCSAYPGPNL